MLEAAVCEDDVAATDDVLDGELFCIEGGPQALDELLHTFFALIGTVGLAWFTLAFADGVYGRLLVKAADESGHIAFAEAMKKQMKGLAGVFQGDNGRVIASVIGAAQDDEQLAKSVREDYLKPRRRIAHDFIKGAILRGEFPESSEAEIEGFIDLLYGGLYFRLLLKHKRPGLDGLERWIDLVFAALKKY